MSDQVAPVQGYCAPRFQPLRDSFEALLAAGEDLGASLAVTLDGEFVVDLWGGWTDEACSQPWGRDTLTNVWSTTKTMSSLAALLLVERGELDPDAPVAHYWPEFAAAGKGGVLVRHVLGHTSGVCGWEQPMAVADLYDWDKSTALLAAQAPWWEPGSASGYHLLNYGHLVGELVRRITGQLLGRFFAEQISAPLGADFHIGLAPGEFARVANVVPPPPSPFDLTQLDPASPMFRTLTNPPTDASVSWSEAWRRADIGAANGHGNARSVARVQSILAGGGETGGVRLLSPRTVERIFVPQARGVDLVLGLPVTMGLGWGLPDPGLAPFIPQQDKICFWGGWGGSLVLVDLQHRMTLAYVMNRMAAGILGGKNIARLTSCAYTIIGRQA